jgi:hypothetical protein
LVTLHKRLGRPAMLVNRERTVQLRSAYRLIRHVAPRLLGMITNRSAYANALLQERQAARQITNVGAGGDAA